MLDQVLYNLVNNAAIHNSGATIIHVSASCHVNLLEIIVEDNGTGFPPAVMKDVFHKFSRDKNLKNAGRGLGLSIVKGFTEAMGGSVDLGKGSLGGAKFTVSLPVKVAIMMKDE
jgi:two-component system sensor histidine kinase KdpD